MVDLIDLSLELTTNTVVLVTRPFSLMTVVCMFGVRTCFFVTHIWLWLVRAIINLTADVCWEMIVWTFAIVCLPVKILFSLHRERLLEMHLHEMQVELENLAWDKKQVEDRLQLTIKDCRIMGSIISELEEEHEKAVAKIELFENELQDLIDENIQVTEMQENCMWKFKAQDDNSSEDVDDRPDTSVTEYDAPLLKTGSIKSKEVVQDHVHRKTWEDKAHNPRGSMECQLIDPLSPLIIPKGLVAGEIVEQCREVALSQSIFSAILTLFVGMIIWEAEDPCMPLVIALFVVVGMSLKSVVQFFFTIKNKPASDAVALLSFNWFILGTLTYRTLPIVANVLVPLVPRLACRMVGSSLLW